MTGRKKQQACRVVLVGRPNVGKSTLFNRLVGSRRAIVAPVPGTTRDVLEAPVEWQGSQFVLVDTGGLFGASADPLHAAVARQGFGALDTADLVLLLVDGRDGLVPADHNVAERVREASVPVVVAVNKIEGTASEARADDVHRLGLEPVLRVSAEHGLGVGDLLDQVISMLPGGAARPVSAREDETEIAIAIVGRPNVGKSSLVNYLAREDRVLVSDMAGTTRDAVDTVVRWQGRSLRLVDTAGIRRPGRVAQSGHVESASVAIARRAMERADVAVVVFDASTKVTHQDAAIAGEAERAGCGIVCAANKWDLVKGREVGFAKRYDEEVRDGLKFADYAPIVHLSALTGARSQKLLEQVERVDRARAAHVATSDLNRFLERVTKRHPPTSPKKREVKIQYATQIGVKPPRFLLFTNTATRLHFSYERFLKNRLRESFGFEGTPLEIRVRVRREPRTRRR